MSEEKRNQPLELRPFSPSCEAGVRLAGAKVGHLGEQNADAVPQLADVLRVSGVLFEGK